MNTRHDNADGPEDIDAAFAEIVAGLERDSPMSRWPEESDTVSDTESDTESDTGDDTASATAAPPAQAATAGVQQGPRDWTQPEEDEGHFEPPEPPPLPKPKPATVLGVAAITVGLALLVIPGLTGLNAAVPLPLGLVAISSGIGWLLFRMRHGPPRDSDDDGARL